MHIVLVRNDTMEPVTLFGHRPISLVPEHRRMGAKASCFSLVTPKQPPRSNGWNHPIDNVGRPIPRLLSLVEQTFWRGPCWECIARSLLDIAPSLKGQSALPFMHSMWIGWHFAMPPNTLSGSASLYLESHTSDVPVGRNICRLCKAMARYGKQCSEALPVSALSGVHV